LPEVLDEVQLLVREHRRALLAAYARIRAAHRSSLARLREVDAALDDLQREHGPAPTSDPPAAADARPIATPGSSASEQVRSLRQEQERLAGRLVLLATSARRILAVERQAELSASYLQGNPGDDEGDDELTELVQLHALQAQEDERRRLAREIHDGPAQAFVNAILELDHCRRLLNSDPQTADTKLERLEGDLRASLSEVRQFVHDLRPGPVADLGLVAALRQYLEDYARRAGLAVSFDADPDLARLPAPIELGVFRIVQEALQNARKHSMAKQVAVSLRRRTATLEIRVRDDGVGFDREARRQERGHFGLSGMSERAVLLRAHLEIISAPGAGTEVHLVVPM
jgi:two-component system sensor histidine kinase DegS